MDNEDGGDERLLVEQYLKSFCIEEIMDEVLNQVVMERPKNPYLAIGALMESKSMPEIMDVSLSSVIVGGLRCGVQASVLTNIGNFSATASYSTPSNQIFRNYSAIIDKLKNILLNVDPTNVTAFDEQVAKVNDLDQAESLALSIACCRAAARHKVVQPYDIVCSMMGHTEEHMSIPVPVVPVVSRTIATGSNLHTQDITICALNVSSFESALEYVLTIASSLSKADLIKTPSSVSSVGCPCVDSPSLAPVVKAVKGVIGDNGLLSKIGVGFHYRGEKLLKQPVEGAPTYVLDTAAVDAPAPAAAGGKAAPPPKGGAAAPAEPAAKTGTEVVDVLAALWGETECVSVDSPLAMSDQASLRALRKKIKETIAEAKSSHSDKLKYCGGGVGGDANCNLQVLIDEHSFSPLKDEEGFINEMPFNTLKLQLNNLSSVTQAVELCKKAKKFQCSVAVAVSDSGSNVETSDSFLADFAVGTGAGQLLGGGLSSTEFLSNYNRVMEIVAGNHKIHYVGGKFRGKGN